MRLVLLAIVGVVFPAALFWYGRPSRLFIAALAVQICILLVFFLVAWGPALLAQGGLWVIGLGSKLFTSQRNHA